MKSKIGAISDPTKWTLVQQKLNTKVGSKASKGRVVLVLHSEHSEHEASTARGGVTVLYYLYNKIGSLLFKIAWTFWLKVGGRGWFAPLWPRASIM